jgi:carbonic anhydrase
MDAGELVARANAGGSASAAMAAGGLAAPPSRHTTIVTCMDARIDPVLLFGLRPGEAHILRNAGGVVTDDVVRSLSVSQRKLGTRTVLLVQHTRCGMATFTDEAFAEELLAATGERPAWAAGTFTDPAASVAAGVTRLRSEKSLMPDASIRGYVLDIESFGLTEVTP